MTAPVLSADDLAIGYAPVRRPPHIVAEHLQLALHAGELVCLIGPNGAGKSTLMRTLAGMQKPLYGQVKLLGDDLSTMPVTALARRLSVVLTERVDPGLLTGYALVALGRHPYTDWSGRLSVADETVVQWAVAAVGAGALAGRYMHELSDGERQKMFIARALAQEPAVMLLDEPTAFLDLPRRVEIMQVLRKLAHNTGRAVLLSTHDLDLALRSADRIWMLASGGMLYTGAPEDLVLNGAFEQAFQGEGVAFDRQTGSFRLTALQDANMPVALVGEGIAALWTRRALERAGFTVVDTEEAAITVVVSGAEPLRWEVRFGAQQAACTSLYALVRWLRLAAAAA